MVLRQYAEQQLKQLQRSLSQTLSTGDAKAIHHTRVASRRLTEPLELCRPSKGNKLVDQAIKQIKKVRKSLQAVRELDVLRSSLAKPSAKQDKASLPAVEGLTSKDIKALRKELSNRRDRSMQKAKRKLSEIDHKALGGIIDRIFDDLESTKGYRPESTRRRLAKSIAAQTRQVIKNTPNLKGDAELHTTRLRLKSLRYMVELKLTLTDEQCNDLIGPFKAVQDQLGDWSDQLVAATRLSRIAERRRVMMEWPEFAEHLLSHAASRLRRSQELAKAFRDEWPEFSKFLTKLADNRAGRQKGR